MKIRIIDLDQEINAMYGKTENFIKKTKTSYNNTVSAISYESNNYAYSAKKKWREIYVMKFPE